VKNVINLLTAEDWREGEIYTLLDSNKHKQVQSGITKHLGSLSVLVVFFKDCYHC